MKYVFWNPTLKHFLSLMLQFYHIIYTISNSSFIKILFIHTFCVVKTNTYYKPIGYITKTWLRCDIDTSWENEQKIEFYLVTYLFWDNRALSGAK